MSVPGPRAVPTPPEGQARWISTVGETIGKIVDQPRLQVGTDGTLQYVIEIAETDSVPGLILAPTLHATAAPSVAVQT